jgi:glycosyltransferase involved in cell wall biosynthesis
MASVEIVLPVYNEQRVLSTSVHKLHAYMTANVFHDWRITIADNGSHDGTLEIAERLALDLPHVSVFHVPEAGRGRALTRAWLNSDADVAAYMDIDLSTGLESLPPLLDAVATGRADIVSGTRLGPGAQTNRSLKREVLSRGYVFMINAAFRGVKLLDTQCGFKAISRECAQTILPLVRDTGWFWDTELLLLVAKGSWRVRYIPVRWQEDTDSRVKIASTVRKDLQGLWRMRSFDWRQAAKHSSVPRELTHSNA